jgi:hypothetical protein
VHPKYIQGANKIKYQVHYINGLWDKLYLKYMENVIQLYIRVSVVLIWSLCRKEREKLYITLDSMVVMLARVKEI